MGRHPIQPSTRFIVKLILSIIFVMIVVGWLCWEIYRDNACWVVDEVACDKAMMVIGDIELRGSSYAQLVNRLGKPNIVRRSGGLTNVVLVCWWGPTIRTEFIGFVDADLFSLIEHDEPIAIRVQPPFKGSLAGVHLGDSPEKFMATQYQVHSTVYEPGASVIRDGVRQDASGEIHMEAVIGDWRMECVAKEGKINSIEMQDTRSEFRTF